MFQKCDRGIVSEAYGEYARSGFSMVESGVGGSELGKESEYTASFRIWLFSGCTLVLSKGRNMLRKIVTRAEKKRRRIEEGQASQT